MFYFPSRACVLAFAVSFLIVSLLQAKDGTPPSSAPPPLPTAQWLMPNEIEEDRLFEEMPELDEIRNIFQMGDGVAGRVGRMNDRLGGEFETVEPVAIDGMPLPPIPGAPASEIHPRNENSLERMRRRLSMDALLTALSYSDVPGQRISWPGTTAGKESVYYVIDSVDGEIVSSGSSLDVAIVGWGFFRITSTRFDGIQYTRCGRLVRSESGELCVLIREEEFPLDPPIVIPEEVESLMITPQGEVIGSTSASSDEEEVSTYRTLGFIQLAVYEGSMPSSGPGRFSAGDPAGEEFYGMPGTEVKTIQMKGMSTQDPQEISLRVGLLRPFALESSSVDAQRIRALTYQLVDEMISDCENE